MHINTYFPLQLDLFQKLLWILNKQGKYEERLLDGKQQKETNNKNNKSDTDICTIIL